jgi:catechol 2,3-dioxygenase-like lactoylglutathione lyase family enzyme
VRDIDFSARRIAGFGLTSPDADRLMEFYTTTFGARLVWSEHLTGPRFEREMSVRGGALRHTLQLGREAIDIVQFDTPGCPYPRPLSPYDNAFQHFALVVSDMDLAVARLQGAAGWTPISSGGPQRLPQRSGGVTAFKFQDPDGHPLELLAFPEHAVPPHWKDRSAYGIFLGVDHSAICVRDTAISTAFYQSLGFAVIAATLNHGAEQANLDGVPSPRVEVTALSLTVSTPHLELLCYRSEVHPPRRVLSSNDVAATRIVLAAAGAKNDVDSAREHTADTARQLTADTARQLIDTTRQLVVDPDGHHLLLAS